jgi:hypothetical protein
MCKHLCSTKRLAGTSGEVITRELREILRTYGVELNSRLGQAINKIGNDVSRVAGSCTSPHRKGNIACFLVHFCDQFAGMSQEQKKEAERNPDPIVDRAPATRIVGGKELWNRYV